MIAFVQPHHMMGLVEGRKRTLGGSWSIRKNRTQRLNGDCSRDEGSRPLIAPARPITYSAIDAAHAEVFDLEELLDAVFRAFAADAAFLHAAEGRDLGRDDALIDADDAVFEGLGDAPDAADVAISRRSHANLSHMAAGRCDGCV
jgi:hypothetical protein